MFVKFLLNTLPRLRNVLQSLLARSLSDLRDSFYGSKDILSRCIAGVCCSPSNSFLY